MTNCHINYRSVLAVWHALAVSGLASQDNREEQWSLETEDMTAIQQKHQLTTQITKKQLVLFASLMQWTTRIESFHYIHNAVYCGAVLDKRLLHDKLIIKQTGVSAKALKAEYGNSL